MVRQNRRPKVFRQNSVREGFPQKLSQELPRKKSAVHTQWRDRSHNPKSLIESFVSFDFDNTNTLSLRMRG